MDNNSGMHHNNGFPSVNAYKQRFEQCDEWENERKQAENNLILNYERLHQQFEVISLDLAAEVDGRRQLQAQVKDLRQQIVMQKQAMDDNPFAFVILDGDGAIFHDELYAHGKEGGERAAGLLHTELKTYLKELYPDRNVSAWSIIVQVVLNADGLSRKLYSLNIIKQNSDLTAFGAAFGISQPLFSFVDVGVGKEHADHKVRETLRVMMRIAQCKHIVFGPCHDNGYIPVLAQYKADPDMAARLTLLETVPSQPGFVDLGFKRTSFLTIFRDENLPGKAYGGSAAAALSPAPGFHQTAGTLPNLARSASMPPAPAVSLPSPKPGAASPETTWVTVGKTGMTLPSKTLDISAKRSGPRRYYVVNQYDERIDERLQRPDPTADNNLHNRMVNHGKLCNRYHLSGRCDGSCGYDHGEKLTISETAALRIKARGIKCPRQVNCDDVMCFLGHTCKFLAVNGEGRCPLPTCQFKDTHSIDMHPAFKVFEDGCRERMK